MTVGGLKALAPPTGALRAPELTSAENSNKTPCEAEREEAEATKLPSSVDKVVQSKPMEY